jgi:hypothetical protein
MGEHYFGVVVVHCFCQYIPKNLEAVCRDGHSQGWLSWQIWQVTRYKKFPLTANLQLGENFLSTEEPHCILTKLIDGSIVWSAVLLA